MLIYWVEVYILLRNTEALIVDLQETGLEVNCDKPKYMVISKDPNSG
jgi:hypothetical protein